MCIGMRGEKNVRLKALVGSSHSKRSHSSRIGDSNYSISPFIYINVGRHVEGYMDKEEPERSIWNCIHL